MNFKKSFPYLLIIAGLGSIVYPLIQYTIYANILTGCGVTLLCISWICANLFKKEELKESGRWEEQKKVMIALGLVMGLGLSMLTYYEAQMPKYKVALSEKNLYTVPPHLTTKELRAMGAECNMEGDVLCAYGVFARIVKLDPRDFISLANLAMTQSHMGFHEHAIQNFELAIHNGAQTYDIYKFYGNSLLAMKQKQKAIKAYTRSLMKNPYQTSLRKKVKKLTE